MTEITDKIITATLAVAELPIPAASVLEVRYDDEYDDISISIHMSRARREDVVPSEAVDLLLALGSTIEFEQPGDVPRWAEVTFEGVPVTVYLTWVRSIDEAIVEEYRHRIEGA